MTSEQFSDWLRQKTPELEAWGDFVVDTIQARVRVNIGEERSKGFFKVAPSRRVKDIDSALKKQKKKQYAEPSVDMTDLVGARFVVLLSSDIPVVEDAIVSCAQWSASRERHYSDEAKSHPGKFDYQSVHYLVVCPEDFSHDKAEIRQGTVCEVQVRSLLQHAYAELVHDNIYKPEGHVPARAERLVARCMALMEATDDMFCAAVHELQSVNKNVSEWCSFLDEKYTAITGKHVPAARDETALSIIETYRDILQTVKREDVSAMLGSQYYQTRIKERSNDGLFSGPGCLLVYWLAKYEFDELKQRWPFLSLSDDVSKVCADVGAKWN